MAAVRRDHRDRPEGEAGRGDAGAREAAGADHRGRAGRGRQRPTPVRSAVERLKAGRHPRLAVHRPGHRRRSTWRKALGADAIEFQTASYSEAVGAKAVAAELAKLTTATAHAKGRGLHVHMGHGLNYWNVQPVVRIAGVEELNIGHSICQPGGAGRHGAGGPRDEAGDAGALPEPAEAGVVRVGQPNDLQALTSVQTRTGSSRSPSRRPSGPTSSGRCTGPEWEASWRSSLLPREWERVPPARSP